MLHFLTGIYMESSSKKLNNNKKTVSFILLFIFFVNSNGSLISRHNVALYIYENND